MKFIRLLSIFVILAIGGGVFLFNGIRDKIEWDKPHGDLETLTEKDLYVGRFVEGEIYELWDEFAYTSEYDTTLGIQTSKERKTDRYFALPLEYSFYGDNDLMFVAVSSRRSDELKVFEKMEKETLDYYNGLDYNEYTTTHFVGKVQKLSGEYLGFFRKYIARIYKVSEADASEYYAPYVLVSYANPDGIVTFIVIGAVMTFLGVVGTVNLIIRKVIRGK
ncbi:MAG: hypothetical protein J1F03_03195 [Oscillospiraceae bacterium]|nr:hypothetical protein [Oscillospiraceae bacterium]